MSVCEWVSEWVSVCVCVKCEVWECVRFVNNSNKSCECLCVWVCVSVCVCFVSDSNKSNEHVEMDAEMEAVYDGWNFMSFQNQITSK